MGAYERDPHEHYVEPPWTSARLFAHEAFPGRVIDPACGWGRIVRNGTASGVDMLGFDLVERELPPGEPAFRRGIRFAQDFMEPTWWPGGGVDCIVSNPPFKLCNVRDMRRAGRKTFAALALERATRKVALLMPSTWHQGDETSRWLQTTPLLRVWFLTPRPSMPPGRYLAEGQKPGNGKEDYAWYVWLHGYDGEPVLRWLRRDA